MGDFQPTPSDEPQAVDDKHDLLDEALWHLPIGERFSTVADELILNRLHLGVRMRNILGRERLDTFGDIRGMSVNDLLAFRGAGVGSVRELLDSLLLEMSSHSPFASSADATVREPEPAWKGLALADLETLARWHRILGSEDVSVLSVSDGVVEPPQVAVARARITALSASDILPDVEGGGAATAAVEAALEGLDDRQLIVLRDRIMADDPLSLDELGVKFDVTRERIRQIESKLIARLTALAESGDLHCLSTIASGAIGSLIGLRTLVQRHRTLGEHVPSIAQPVWRFLDRIDPSYEIRDGWCARGTVVGAISRTKSDLARLAGDRRFIELAAVDEPNLDLTEEWLEYCGVTLLRGCALIGRAGITDRAEVILHTQQEQMSADALVAELGVERSVRSLRNQLSEDPRFARVDRDDWALTTWGLTGYLGIRAMIGRSLSAAGGELTIDELITDITSRFDVSPRSIVTYATSFPYITLKGVVRRRARRDMRRPRRKGLAQTRGLYRHNDTVKLRIVVNSEHLRGSGSPLPNALGEEIDLSVAEAKSLRRAGHDGTILVSWRGPQIILGSVRSEVEKLGLAEGDLAFFVFGPDGIFSVEPVGASDSTESRILALTGDALAGDEGVWASLADRIDSSANDPDSVLAALAARGDARIVEIARSHAMYSVGLGEDVPQEGSEHVGVGARFALTDMETQPDELPS